MKRCHLIILLLGAMLFSACVRDGSTDCEGSCTLRFILPDGNNNNIGVQKIDHIDILLYDGNDVFFGHRKAGKKELGEEMSIEFSLPPGEYKIVCWANVCENSNFNGLTAPHTFSDGFLETVSPETGSPVYYAPSSNPERFAPEDLYTLVSVAGKRTEKDLCLIRSYRNIQVYIQDVENMPGYDGNNPSVRITSLPYRSDFFMNIYPGYRDFEKRTAAVEISGRGFYQGAAIRSFYNEISPQTYMTVKNRKGEATMEPLNIRDYIRKQGIGDDHEINILVKYTLDADVLITIPEWETIPIIPN